MKQKKEAAKHGKAIAPIVHENPAYESVAQKINNDPELAKFLELI